jgi:hypothetical protein
VPLDAHTQAVQQALGARDYPRIVELLAPDPAGPLARTLRFARNMIALRALDPELALEIEQTPPTARVRIITAPDGRDSLAPGGGGENPFCPGGSPTAVVAHTERHLAENPDPSRSIALAGVGDGWALTRLAGEPADPLGRRRAVLVIEPDAEMFRAAMMLHDWRTGPLGEGRFILCVGRAWRERLLGALAPDARVPPPGQAIRQCADPAPIRDALREAVGALSAAVAQRRRELARVYAPVTPGAIADRLLEPADARVLLLTTRYSTVLQHSTRDFAEGFARLGCVVRVVIEDQPWEQHLIASLLGEVLAFRPDLVLQIDHHRHETPGVIPAQVPFVCIIQDNLPNLLTRDAAAKMGPTDFAAGSWVRRYVLDHAYPARRTFEIPRLARAPETPAVHRGGGVDLLYVSNHSATPERATEQALASIDPGWARAREIVRAVSDDLIALYDAGGCVEDSTELDRFVADRCRARSLDAPGPEALLSIGDTLGVTVNNALYRRQGLRWARRAAEALGLTLRIHGWGWADHPEFAPFAAGVIDYRAGLPEATTRTRACLVLEPYFPTQHQRALDTWLAGGLPLIRRRARDDRHHDFLLWLDRLGPGVDSFESALSALPPGEAPAFRAAHEAQQGLHAWDGRGDLVALYRARERDGIAHAMRTPPGFDQTSFRDGAGFLELVRRLVGDPSQFEKIRRAQHDWARAGFSYEAGARRLMMRIADALPR